MLGCRVVKVKKISLQSTSKDIMMIKLPLSWVLQFKTWQLESCWWYLVMKVFNVWCLVPYREMFTGFYSSKSSKISMHGTFWRRRNVQSSTLLGSTVQKVKKISLRAPSENMLKVALSWGLEFYMFKNFHAGHLLKTFTCSKYHYVGF
jgi:hypothetical protein